MLQFSFLSFLFFHVNFLFIRLRYTVDQMSMVQEATILALGAG